MLEGHTKGVSKAPLHVLARGVWYLDGHILLCRFHSPQGVRSFLPGGHVEDGESARQCVVREIKEEVGKEVSAQSFMGVVEHRIGPGFCHRQEIQMLFWMKGPENELVFLEERLSDHPKITLQWWKLQALEQAEFSTPGLWKIVLDYIQRITSTAQVPAPFYFSTLDNVLDHI